MNNVYSQWFAIPYTHRKRKRDIKSQQKRNKIEKQNKITLTDKTKLKKLNGDREKREMMKGSGCGSDGRAVASDSKDQRFESCIQQNLY